jgi:hypothetical protein
MEKKEKKPKNTIVEREKQTKKQEKKTTTNRTQQKKERGEMHYIACGVDGSGGEQIQVWLINIVFFSILFLFLSCCVISYKS